MSTAQEAHTKEPRLLHQHIARMKSDLDGITKIVREVGDEIGHFIRENFNLRREILCMRGRQKAKELRKTMKCNCDLDRWQPEESTGHSHVCRIHKAAILLAQPKGGEHD